MNKKIVFLLALCCLISMTGCSKEEIIEHYNQAICTPHFA